MLGLQFIAFSKEAFENEDVMMLRLHSLLITSYLFLSLVVLTILFVFGFAFINVLISEIFMMPVAYIVIFRYHYHNYLKEIGGNPLHGSGI